MSRWLGEKAERNRQALARLSKRLPTIFPPAVLARALGRPFIPPTPRLAIKSYGVRIPSGRGSPGPEVEPLELKVEWAGPEHVGQVVKLGCQQHSERHRLRTASERTVWGRGIVASAASLSINSAGTGIYANIDKHERGMALCMRCCLAILECTE